MKSIFHTIPIFLLSKLGYQNNRVSSKRERKKRKGLRIHTQTLYLAKFSMEYLTPPPSPPSTNTLSYRRGESKVLTWQTLIIKRSHYSLLKYTNVWINKMSYYYIECDRVISILRKIKKNLFSPLNKVYAVSLNLYKLKNYDFLVEKW